MSDRKIIDAEFTVVTEATNPSDAEFGENIVQRVCQGIAALAYFAFVIWAMPYLRAGIGGLLTLSGFR